VAATWREDVGGEREGGGPGSAGEGGGGAVVAELGYFKERDGSWVGFNGDGEAVAVDADDATLKEWMAVNV